MTDKRTLMSIIRDAARRARNIKKLTAPKEIGKYCIDEANLLGAITPEWIEEAKIEKALKYIVWRQKPKLDDEERQLHLFHDCEDIVFDIRHGDGTVQKVLGDFDQQDIEQVTQQKMDNIARAEAEAELWARAINLVLPLVRDNPGWVWRDAVNDLAASGLV